MWDHLPPNIGVGIAVGMKIPVTIPMSMGNLGIHIDLHGSFGR